MISSSLLQVQYNRLYDKIRNYIWDFETVELISELEMEVYTMFFDAPRAISILNKLRRSASSVLKDDEELTEAFDNMSEALEQGIKGVYARLLTYREV